MNREREVMQGKVKEKGKINETKKKKKTGKEGKKEKGKKGGE